MSAPHRPSAEARSGRRRNTPQRRAVLDVLGRDSRFRSAQQLHADLCGSPVAVGLTSVYRILHLLADERVVETQRAEDGELLYRLRDTTTHHHNLLCRICGRAEQFTLDALEQHADRIARRYHYAEVDHRIDLYGICPDCRVAQRDR